MNLIESLPKKLGTAACWVESGGVHWLNSSASSVRELAHAMNAALARFITITATELPGEQGIRLEYHWDLDGCLLGFPFELQVKSIESIYDLCEAVDWAEREVHEGYAVEFAGRAYDPLLLRRGDKLGVNLRKEAE